LPLLPALVTIVPARRDWPRGWAAAPRRACCARPGSRRCRVHPRRHLEVDVPSVVGQEHHDACALSPAQSSTVFCISSSGCRRSTPRRSNAGSRWGCTGKAWPTIATGTTR
jgi:hypothetical protein